MRLAKRSFTYTAFTASLLLMFLSGCSGTNKNIAPAVSEPEPVQAVQPVEETAKPEPTEPEIAPDLKALRACSAQNEIECIQKTAHEIIDRNAANDEKAEALRALAIPAMEEKHFAEAQLYAETALELDATNTATLKLLAVIAHKDNRDDEAVKYLKQAIQAGTEDAEAYALNAAILLSYLDTERALEAAKKAVELQPSDCRSMTVYADALYASHQFNEAVEQYEKADTPACKASEAVLKNMGKIYEVHVQSPQKACQTYERLLQISPENAYYKASRDYQCTAVSE